MALPKPVSPGQPVRAEHFNQLLAAVTALTTPRVGPGLSARTGPRGAPVITLDPRNFAQLIPMVVESGPDPLTPAAIADVKYTFVGVGNADLRLVDRKPDFGRLFDDSPGTDAPAIYPATPGTPAFLLNFSDSAGEPQGLVWLPMGGSAGPWKGERLHAKECEGAALGGQALLDRVMAELGVIAPETFGPLPDGRGSGPNPAPEAPMLINIRQQVELEGYVRLDIDEDAILIDVPPEAVACSMAASLVEDDTTSQTWATSTLTVKAVVHTGKPVDFTTVRGFPAGGGLVQLDEAELAGLHAIEIRRAGTKETTAGRAHITIGFIVTTPATPGLGGGAPVPGRIPSIAVSGAAAPAGPAAPVGD